MNKSQVMEALLDSSSNVPSEIVSFIGMNLPNDAESKAVFNHDADNMFEACGITDADTESLTKALNDYMNSIPNGQRANSKAVEFILNSNNVKWLLICIISAVKTVSISADENDLSDIKKQILTQLLLKKFSSDSEGSDIGSISDFIKKMLGKK